MAAEQLTLPLFPPQPAPQKRTADMQQYHREWRAARRASMSAAEIEEYKRRDREAGRARREASPETVRARKRANYAKHRDDIIARGKAARDAIRQSLPPKAAPLDRDATNAKRRAQRADNPQMFRDRESARYTKAGEAEKRREQERIRRLANLERAREKDRRAAEKNRGHRLAYAREYQKKNAAKMSAYSVQYEKRRKAEDPLFKLKKALRGRLRSALSAEVKGRQRKVRSSSAAIALLGCTLPELIAHIEAQFTDGMSWENWKFRGWHIDHRVPLGSGNLSDERSLGTRLPLLEPGANVVA